MDLGLRGKIAFVGASSKGLGRSVAEELLREGAEVIINGRNLETLKTTQSELFQTYGNKVSAVRGDLADPNERKAVLTEIHDNYQKVDIVVTNTGGPPSGKFEEISQEQWDQTYELLLGSTVEIIRTFLPKMKEQKWGRILTITSQAVKQPVDNLILSNSVRASVVGLVKTLASELGPHNITVNNIMPGYTKTDRLTSLIEKNPQFKDAINEIPLQRFAEPEEFGAVAAFLLSDKASYVTGTSIAVDGGWIKNIL